MQPSFISFHKPKNSSVGDNQNEIDCSDSDQWKPGTNRTGNSCSSVVVLGNLAAQRARMGVHLCRTHSLFELVVRDHPGVSDSCPDRHRTDRSRRVSPSDDNGNWNGVRGPRFRATRNGSPGVACDGHGDRLVVLLCVARDCAGQRHRICHFRGGGLADVHLHQISAIDPDSALQRAGSAGRYDCVPVWR